MTTLTLESVVTSFQDGVYTTLLDYGVEPGPAYEMSRNPLDFIGFDEYAEAEETDNDTLG